jgi:hypothetical protein
MAGMSTTFLLLLSGVLIGAGVTLIWRDVHKRQRDAFVLSRDATAAPAADPDVEITVSRRAASQSLASALAPAAGAPTAKSLGALSQAVCESVLPEAPRPSPTMQQWDALQPAISAAVEQVNAVLAVAGVSLGPSGEPSLSINKAYGSHRRILVQGDSVAWLRLQCTVENTLHAAVKAHKDAFVAINTESSAPASNMTAAQVSDLLSECLKPAAAYTMHTTGPESEQLVSERAWNAVDAVVIGSLKAGNGALAQAGARLVPLSTPAWDPELRHHRMTVAVEVFGEDVARMYIDRLSHEMEVAVGVPEAHLASLGRRQRIAVQGMTTHALAELIASCAWPAIARHRETRRPA